jgi:FKBP-type peptidyl-prolyl cis-trans isomerase FkpA
MKLIHLLFVLSAFFMAGGCKPSAEPPPPASETAQADQITELEVVDVVQGDGEAIAPGQVAVVHYTGWLYDPAAAEGKGQKFDSSRDRGDPFRFPVGAGRVIRGWDQGVAGMKVGGQRRLVIPAELAYGDRGAGGVIPPGATLLFDVELLGIEDGT